MTNTWNANLEKTKTIMQGGSWKATHLAKIEIREGETIYRLANHGLNGEKWSLDLAPDAIHVGGKPVAMRMLKGGGRKEMRKVLNGDRAANPLWKEEVLFNTDPEALNTIHAEQPQRFAAMHTMGGQENNLEHSSGQFLLNTEDGRTARLVTVFFLPTARNALGGGGSRATIYREGPVGTFTPSLAPEAVSFVGGDSGAAYNNQPAFAEQVAVFRAVVAREAEVPLAPPPVAIIAPTPSPVVLVHEPGPEVADHGDPVPAMADVVVHAGAGVAQRGGRGRGGRGRGGRGRGGRGRGEVQPLNKS